MVENLIYCLISLLIGSISVWLIFKPQRERLRQELKEKDERLTQLEIEKSVLEERLAQEKNRFQELSSVVEELTKKLELSQKELAIKQAEIAKLQERITQEENKFREKLEIIEKAKEELENAFKALSSEILQKNTESFFKIAQEKFFAFKQEVQSDLKAKEEAIEALTKPLKETLERISREIKDLEIKREGAYRSIEEQIRALIQDHLPKLHQETEMLARALRQPQVRGKWGEIQLRRVVEMVGMVAHCDFYEQKTLSFQGKVFRPDLIIHLPGRKTIAVDAKVPFDAYIEALESDDEKAKEKFREYARALKNHIQQLANKTYWETIQKEFERAPEFVILFLPAESFFSAVLQADPSILEFGIERNVLLATPVTLIAILKAVAYSWREHAMVENALHVAKLGQELYDRLRTLTKHFEQLGKSLKQAVMHYNSAIGSYEKRVLASARKFYELDIISKEKLLPELEEIESHIKQVSE